MDAVHSEVTWELVEGRTGIPPHFLLELNNFRTCCLVGILLLLLLSIPLGSSRSSSGSCNGASSSSSFARDFEVLITHHVSRKVGLM